MKNSFLLIPLLFSVVISSAQQKKVDSLTTLLKSPLTIEQRIAVLKQLSNQQNDAPVIISYAKQGIVLCKKLNRPKDQEYFLADIGRGYYKNDDYPKELEAALTGLRLSRQLNDSDAFCEFSLAVLVSYDQGNEYSNAINYGLTGLHMAEKIKSRFRILQLCNYIALHYVNVNQLDSALNYMQRCYRLSLASHEPNIGFALYGIGLIEGKLHHPDSALSYYKRAVPAFKKSNVFRTRNLIDAYVGIANIYKNEARLDSALYYADLGYQLTKEANQFQSTYEAAGLLATLYEGKNDKQSLHYYKIAAAAKDSLTTADKTKQLLILSSKERQHRQELEDALQKRRSQLYWASGILVSVFALIFYYRRYRIKKELELERIRSNIAADFHDELGSTLSNIALYTEMAVTGNFSDLQRTKNILSLIGESSRGTISAMQDMIWSIQPKNDTMQEVVYRMREFAYPMAELKNTGLIFNVEKEVQGLTLSMDNRKNIYLVFKEALNNAFKYAYAANIIIDISKQHQCVNLQIRDDGKGFDTGNVTAGNGLRNMRKRAVQSGGTLLIQSNEQRGTTILFSFPVN